MLHVGAGRGRRGRSAVLNLGAPVVNNQTLAFGRLTLGQAGAVAITPADGSITSVTLGTRTTGSDHFEVSGATIRPKASTSPSDAQYVWTGCTATGPGGTSGTFTITVDTEANVYSIAGATELAAVVALGVATVSGKTIKGRHGDYTWTNSTLNNKAFTSEVIITSHDNSNRVRFLIGSKELRSGTNLTFYRVNFYAEFAVGTSIVSAGGIDLKNTISGLKFSDCQFQSNGSALIDAGNNPNAIGFRLLKLNTTPVISTGGLTIIDCYFYGGFQRGLSLPAATGSTGPVTISRNEIRDFIVDGIVIAGPMPDLELNDNIIWAPYTVASQQFNVASVDVANNRMTLTQAHGFSGSPVINVLPTSGSVPGGLTAMTDYTCTVIDATTIQFPVDITSAGSSVIIWEEPPHGDHIQFASGVDTVLKGEIRRNICASIRDDGKTFVDEVQGIFIEDLNGGSHPDTTHPNLIIEGNLIYSRTTQGLFVANSYNSHVFNNTVVGPPDCASSTHVPPIIFGDHFTGTRAGNVAKNNIARSTTTVSPSSGGTITNNIVAFPDAIDTGSSEKYTDVFVNPGSPTSIAELLTMYAIKAGGPADTASPKVGSAGTGYVDYSANTSSSPSEPTDVTGPVLTSISGTQTGATTADLGVSTDTGSGTLYWVVSTSATRPKPSQILAGQDSSGSAAAYATSAAISSTGAKTASATGLTGSTTYYVHAEQVDSAGNYSTVVTSASFTTAVAGVSAALVDNELNDASAGIYTFNNVNLGTAFAGRVIVVCVSVFDTGLGKSLLESCTVAGNAAALQISNTCDSGGSISSVTGIYSIVDESNTTATIVVDLLETCFGCAIHVYALTNASGATASDTDVSDADPGAATLTIPSGGAAIAVSLTESSSGSATPTNLTLNNEMTIESGRDCAAASASNMSSGATALQIDWSGSGQVSTCFAVWGQ
jgi:hypothetical protein